jgi:hypothetical protein
MEHRHRSCRITDTPPPIDPRRIPHPPPRHRGLSLHCHLPNPLGGTSPDPSIPPSTTMATAGQFHARQHRIVGLVMVITEATEKKHEPSCSPYFPLTFSHISRHRWPEQLWTQRRPRYISEHITVADDAGTGHAAPRRSSQTKLWQYLQMEVKFADFIFASHINTLQLYAFLLYTNWTCRANWFFQESWTTYCLIKWQCETVPSDD